MIDTGKMRQRARMTNRHKEADMLSMADEIDELRTAVGLLIAAGDRMWPWTVSGRVDVAKIRDEWQRLAAHYGAE